MKFLLLFILLMSCEADTSRNNQSNASNTKKKIIDKLNLIFSEFKSINLYDRVNEVQNHEWHSTREKQNKISSLLLKTQNLKTIGLSSREDFYVDTLVKRLEIQKYILDNCAPVRKDHQVASQLFNYPRDTKRNLERLHKQNDLKEIENLYKEVQLNLYKTLPNLISYIKIEFNENQHQLFDTDLMDYLISELKFHNTLAEDTHWMQLINMFEIIDPIKYNSKELINLYNSLLKDEIANLALYLSDNIASSTSIRKWFTSYSKSQYEGCYNAELFNWLGEVVDAQEIHDLGWNELEKIEDKMIKIMNTRYSDLLVDIPNNASKQEFIAFALNVINTEIKKVHSVGIFSRVIAEEYVQKSRDFVSQIIDYSFDLPLDLVEFDHEHSPEAYYSPINDSQNGTFQINIGRELPVYHRAWLSYHEGIPGHHLHFGTLYMEKGNLPSHLYESDYSTNTLSEGWALYIEELIEELGLYSYEFAEDLGMLDAQRRRAMRLIGSTGINHLGWDLDKVEDLFIKHTNLDSFTIESEKYRAQGSQVLTYWVSY